MQLTSLGRIIYGVLALGSSCMLVRYVAHADWLGAVFMGVMTLIWGVPAIRGQDSLADLPLASSWLIKARMVRPRA